MRNNALCREHIRLNYSNRQEVAMEHAEFWIMVGTGATAALQMVTALIDLIKRR
jgi:hypothetical protein